MLEINNTTKQKINKQKTQRLVEEFLRVFRKQGYEVSLAIVGASKMQTINYQYRRVNRATDVLSFPGEAAKKYLGEIIINLPEAEKTRQELIKEGWLDLKTIRRSDYIFYFLVVHGLLHLVGYQDEREDDRKKMLVLGKKFLESNL